MGRIKLSLLAIASFIFFVLSYLVPKQKNLILFGSGHGKKFGGNPKYLYLSLLKNRKYNAFWITKNKNLYLKLKSKNFPVIYRNSLKGILSILKAKWLFFNYDPEDVFIWPFLYGKFNAINTWHSVPIKLMGNDEFVKSKDTSVYKMIYNSLNRLFKFNKKHYEIMVSTSDFSSQNLKSAFSPQKILLSGYPKDDIFFDNTISIENLKSKLNLSNYKKIFFYAPTLREYTKLKPFSPNFLIRLNDYLKKTNSIFLITKHPSTKEIVVPGKYSQIINVTEEVGDTHELLKEADVFITDYSGLIVDFTQTNKPIILYCYDIEQYKKERGLYIDLDKFSPGLVAKNELQIFDFIKNIDKLFKSKKVRQKYNEFKDRYQKYQNGGNSKRLLNMLKIN